MNKFYRHKDQFFFGWPRSGLCYLIELDDKFNARYLFEDGSESKWEKVEPYYQNMIKKGIWLEIAELPEKPWEIKTN